MIEETPRSGSWSNGRRMSQGPLDAKPTHQAILNDAIATEHGRRAIDDVRHRLEFLPSEPLKAEGTNSRIQQVASTPSEYDQ